MGVPFYNFNELHHSDFKLKIKERIGHIIDHNAFVEGEFNHKFESDFAKAQDAKHCLLVANGTDALEIALKVFDVGPGDLVGVPGITFYATAEAVLNVGATPVWIDVDPLTGVLCLESLKRVHSQKPIKAVMPVHIYGIPAPMEEIISFCDSQHIAVVEDAAQAQGASYENGKPVGSYNTLTTFSFYPTKNLSAFGDAGCILTQSDELAEKIKVERNHGRGNEQAMGRNSRCDHIQAAVLDLKLQEVACYNLMRKDVAKKYHIALAGLPIELIPNKYITLSSWHLYPIQVESKEVREALSSHLKAHEIGHTPFYERSMAQEPALKDYEGESEKADHMAGRCICLPMNPFLKDQDIAFVADTVRKFFS